MNKVKLSQKMANAIEEAKEGYSPVDIIELYFANNLARLKTQDIDLDTLIKALYYGYEVEQTPEDKVREYYNKLRNSIISNPDMEQAQDEWRAKMEGIEKTLDLLNIKIEGVNA